MTIYTRTAEILRYGVTLPSQNIRQVAACSLILALMLPIAIPIPTFGSTLMLSKQKGLGLTLETSLLQSASDLISSIPLTIASFVGKVSKRGPSSGNNLKLRTARIRALVTPIEGQQIGMIVGESRQLTALPVDSSGNAVSGVPVEWTLPECDIARIESDRIVALKPGVARLRLRVGNREDEFEVVIGESPASSMSVVYDDVDENLYRTFFSPQENLGTPGGQVEAQSPASAAAFRRSIERPGSSNFSFSLPIAGSSARGASVGVDLVYNSRLWSLWKPPFGSLPSKYWYNQQSDWLAPGFKMTLGSLRRLDYYNFSLTSPNGTQHQLHYVSGNNYARTYESADGTFVKLDITADGSTVNSPALVSYPDGTKVEYSRISTSTLFFPTNIKDRNGNITQVAYKPNDTVGRIWYIKDSLNRYSTFHYDLANKLVAVTVPGLDGGPVRETIRFYYDTIDFDTTTQRFTGTVSAHNVPTSATVLEYIYFPGNNTGYKYEYSPAWGMIYKVSNLRGMTVDSSSLTVTGSVTSDGETAASTTYNYPMTLGAPLTEVPAYTTRTDDWLGRTTTHAPVTSFSVNKNTADGRVETRITAPDGTITESWAKIALNSWNDGLITDVFTKSPDGSFEKEWSHTKTFWGNQSSAPGRKNIRINKIENTNDAVQTKATTFEYDNYNNQTKITEHDFDLPGDEGDELRRTEITYENGNGWINNRLANLPKSVKTFVGTTIVSRTDYEYDGSSLVEYGPTPITQHDPTYNSGVPPGQHCSWVCPTACQGLSSPGDCQCPLEEECTPVPVFNSATNYRGNVTKVTSFADPANAADPDKTETTVKYDVVGNMVETGADCCKKREWVYSSTNLYAWPTKQKDGDAGLLETTFSYDFNTGLLLNSVDPNMQPTSLTYDGDTLRQTRVDMPNGAWAETEFNDTEYPYHVKTTSSLDASRSVSGWSFINGIGQGFRSRNQTAEGYLSNDVDFDNMGRAVKSFTAYTVTNRDDTRPGGVSFTAATSYDGLGRVLTATLPDGTTVQNEYLGLVATVTDQAGKKRRQTADSLDRIVRVDEPDASGVLGNQPTHYEYDGNDNLVKVIQSDGTITQERLFKYDGLSRLTHEREVEANATLNDAGVYIGGSGTWTGVYKYDTDSLLEWGVDARGVKTTFGYDGLNRILTVTYSGESGYQTPMVTYTYDQTESGTYNKGRLTKVETAEDPTYGTPATIQNYRYDKVGQVIKHTQSIGSETYFQEYGYNLAGQMTAQKYPSGRVVETEIDNFGRMAEVSDAQRTYVSGLAFNAQGMLSQINLGNGTNEAFAYNDRFQMTSQSLNKGTEALQRYEYGYGEINFSTGNVDPEKNNGQLAKIESFIGTNKQASQRFGYDQLGRLEEAREHRGDNDSLTYKQVFDFDRFGNKYRKAASNPTTGQANPLPFTPIEEATTPGTGDIDKATNRFRTGTTYDDAGQVIGDSKFRELAFAYDANGRQVKATKTNQPDAWTVYDALGNRVATKINEVWQLMVYDAFGKLVAEYGVAAETTGGVKYIQQDWQGSVRTVTNSNGFVVARTDHQAFGEDIGVGVGLRKVEQGYSADKTTRQGYGLTENDSSGLSHTWFRKLETVAGRWSSPDPYKGSMRLGNPQSFNRYSYVVNTPTNLIDPSGLDPLLDAVNLAKELLKFGPCGKLIGSNADQVLAEVYRKGRISLVSRIPDSRSGRRGQIRHPGRAFEPDELAVMRVLTVGGRVIKGSERIYVNSANFLPLSLHLQAQAIIHELMHYVGNNLGLNPFSAAFNEEHDLPFKNAIYSRCIYGNPEQNDLDLRNRVVPIHFAGGGGRGGGGGGYGSFSRISDSGRQFDWLELYYKSLFPRIIIL